ncbi:tyrosyl-DNA phosphodiesterase [Tricladium varicosporioides]|nr:tyrosyl-DNA phosphodiesterase [Hymenoscyphus varicosporioides]
MDSSREPSQKRQKLGNENDSYVQNSNLPRTFTSSISPPKITRKQENPGTKLVSSPFNLTWIRDLPESSNIEAVNLKDILGDPLISECWEFNYLHDLDFLMSSFDEDVRDLIKVHVIHGFWKSEDQSRQNLSLQAQRYPNIKLHTAFMPEMFGTHHSKMLILLRHDDTAQVIIHTANMIAFDWTNMTQAVWKSPLLPKNTGSLSMEDVSSVIGSGSKFKLDLLNYLKAYDTRRVICKPLIVQLQEYDFSAIRAALIASVPGKQGIETDSESIWGWPGLKKILKSVPVQLGEPEIVIQISSIATLGQNDKWLDKTLFHALRATKNMDDPKAKFKIIFPTADEIRRSLNGYSSGNAIHLKVQSAAQAKQLQYLKPFLCHWAGDAKDKALVPIEPTQDAGRKRAAPHIKTYIRFTDNSKSTIDWMLITSANLSRQAWGEAINAAGDIRICSYEIGVMVWPELYGENATMVPTFKTDAPTLESAPKSDNIVGARMPYDLPLTPYGRDDIPWCATASYDEPDWMGATWNV